MVEAAVAWILLVTGIIQQSGEVLMAAGLFAVACNLCLIRDEMRGKH